MNIFEYLVLNLGDAGFEPEVSEHPVTALPGSRAKFLAMVARIERGEELFHPMDQGLLSDREADGEFFR